MGNLITYEVNQLGGRWQRTGSEAGVGHFPAPGAGQRRIAGLRWGIVMAGLAFATVVGLVIANSSASLGAGLSSYAGAGGSYPLVAGLSLAAPLAYSSGPPTQLPSPQSAAILPAASAGSLAQRKAAPDDYNLLGKPSISVATIEQTLQQYHSPAVGNGQAFYDLGVKYGVDPAFMLAFYVHESAAGTMGAAVATRSVGNIICAGWSGACIGRFRAYDSYVQAAEDWYQLITGPLYIGAGLTTPDQITPRYAPSSDNNDPNGYAQTVERLVDQWRS